MKFYTYIFVIIVIFLREIRTDGNPELFSEAGLETPNPSSIGLIFFIKINNTSHNYDYDVQIAPDICCLKDVGGFDCGYLNIIGGCFDVVLKGGSKTLKVAAPLLDVYERVGFCTVFIDSKTNNGPNKRDTVKINFDTTIENNDFKFVRNLKHCENRDEDPFNDCRPVNCETYYNGIKPYFSRKRKRCIAVPACISDDESEYPTVIYNPISNQCDGESINERDLGEVKELSRKSRNRHAKDVLIIKKFEPNDTEIDNTIDLIDNVISITTTPMKYNVESDNNKNVKKYCLKSFWKRYFMDNKWTLIVLSSVITIQCFLICTMIFWLTKACKCNDEKKVVRKFFNYRQDVSVTTPLIGTSNIDIETDFQYLSETSNNAEQKIKCYKACQKENQNLKTSMSDDILSKCLNRRDWKKFKSEAITEINKDAEVIKGLDNANANDADLSKAEKVKRNCETKVAFEDEKAKEQNKAKTEGIVDNTERLEFDDSDVEPNNISSEQEIKCHSYNCFEVSELRPMKKESRYIDDISKTGAPSTSPEKGAQIYFSNDSIDDFLSERGVTYLVGENISKYTFSSDFNDVRESAASTVSSKTKKNIFKNVLTLLRKKSKLATSSDPGRNEEMDVKLLHMSKASVYTSSNDSDYVRTLKRNDSRTSF
ncbi:uncharacterized protein LOC124541852 [Vanessa cardui]|uniref:uncharacterized protein LOC124541852 n=1 Tax=Vanessa cardui TaxID=171605 RepID=UPI001F12A028|nr:uncharacterized protein LOC124541852 [Vanessa cardui]